MDVSIRNIDEETWHTFKSEVSKRGMTMSEYFEILVEQETNWEAVLSTEPSLTDDAAEEIRKASKTIRKEFEMQ